MSWSRQHSQPLPWPGDREEPKPKPCPLSRTWAQLAGNMVPEVWNMFHVPNMCRTSCSEHVPNVQDCYLHLRNPYGMPLDLKYENFVIFKNCLHFSFSKNRILEIAISTIFVNPKIQIPIICENLGSMFWTGSEHLVRHSVLCQVINIVSFSCWLSKTCVLTPRPIFY